MKNENYYTKLPAKDEVIIIISGIIALSLLFQYITAGVFLYESY